MTSRTVAGHALLAVFVCAWCLQSALADDWRKRQEKWWTVSEAAYDALVALEPARREAEAKGDGRAVDRIASATEGLLVLFDDQNSDAAMRKLVALSYFDLGAASSEIYECIVVRKGRVIAPIIKEEIRTKSNPCLAAFGQGSAICSPEARDAKRLRLLLAMIERDEPCTIMR